LFLLLQDFGMQAFWYVQHMILKTSNLEAEYQQHAAQTQTDKSLEQFLARVGTSTNSLTTRLVASNQTVPFIESIEGSARKIGITITTNSVDIAQDPTLPEKYEYLKLAFSTQGSWQNTYTFLSMIESLPYKSTINDVNLTEQFVSGPAEKGTSTQLRGSIWKTEYQLTVLKEKDH
jgi:Tfp pilus assembly protein PilO